MIKKYSFGTPVPTGAVLADIPAETAPLTRLKRSEDGLTYNLTLNPKDMVLGLGETIRGINKRGWHYTSCCADDPNHTETKESLYGAHNYLLIVSEESFAFFFDCPGVISFDIGYTDANLLIIRLREESLDLYVIEGDSPLSVALEFRKLLGRSYIPPRWAFGYQQSRWGYRNAADVCAVVENYRSRNLPLDSVCMDIDYMTDYKDFTVDDKKFPDFSSFTEQLRKEHIHLIPIIDAGVKIQDGYDVYEEGKKNNYFCKREDGTDFVAGVWPGKTHFPDFLNSDARRWFGDKYRTLIDAGVEGFWNDMNEPAVFYSEEGLARAKQEILRLLECELDVDSFFRLMDTVGGLCNNPEDYKRFYHNMDGVRIRHDRVHNLYGYNMTRAASEAFGRIRPGKRLLLYSRASYPGMHRYGGIWTGDNQSWWSHLLLNIKMMPSLNMCGFLYSGADLGGFGSDTTADLLLRWLQFGIFTPLMRNHSAHDTREQEAFRFEPVQAFRSVLQLRYRLLPYLYSEYMKTALADGLLFRPLMFDYPEDTFLRHVEDQLMFADGLMLAPVYEQNAPGRYVYLPEDMLLIKFAADGNLSGTAAEDGTKLLHLHDGTPVLLKKYPKGHAYIEVALEETAFFIRPGKLLPLAVPAVSEELIDYKTLELIGYAPSHTQLEYDYYTDDGYTTEYSDRRIHFTTTNYATKTWHTISDCGDMTVLRTTIIE